jgi:putative transposase
VTWAVREKSYSQRRACGLVGLHPKTYRYASKRSGDEELRKRLRELASQRRRFGYLSPGDEYSPLVGIENSLTGLCA